MLNRFAVVTAVFLLGTCAASGEGTGGPKKNDDARGAASAASTSPKPPGKVEQVLLEQLSCKAPPEAGAVMEALLARRLIADTQEGGDGTRVYMPVKPMYLLGFKVIRLEGWQFGDCEGAMTPFARVPGTAPGTFFSVTVAATKEAVEKKLSALSMTMEQQESRGGTAFGPHVRDGEREYADDPAQPVTEIRCSLSHYGYRSDIQERLKGP